MKPFCIGIDCMEPRGHHRSFLKGIEDYCAGHCLDWDLLHLGQGSSPGTLPAGRRPDGIIGTQFFFKQWHDWASAQELPQARIFIGVAPPARPGLASLLIPAADCARVMVTHACEAGYRAAVICEADFAAPKNSIHRALVDCCAAAKLPLTNLATVGRAGMDGPRLLQAQLAHLASLEGATIFLAKNDKTASWWYDAAAMHGIGVPDPLGFLGAGDNLQLTELHPTGLSSLQLPDRHLGRLAARHLHRMLCGDPAPREPITIPPLRVVPRATTALRRHLDPTLTRAIAIMGENLATPLTQQALARELGCTHWQLWRAFHHTFGCGPKAYQLRLRLAHAEELLRTTVVPLREIATRCGFASARTLRTAFAQRYGMAPRSYRKMAADSSRGLRDHAGQEDRT